MFVQITSRTLRCLHLKRIARGSSSPCHKCLALHRFDLQTSHGKPIRGRFGVGGKNLSLMMRARLSTEVVAVRGESTVVHTAQGSDCPNQRSPSKYLSNCQRYSLVGMRVSEAVRTLLKHSHLAFRTQNSGSLEGQQPGNKLNLKYISALG